MHCVMESGREDGVPVNGIPWNLNSKVGQEADLSQKPKLEKSESSTISPILMPGHISGGIPFPLPGPLGGDVHDGWKVHDRHRNFTSHETSFQESYSYPFLWWNPHHQTGYQP